MTDTRQPLLRHFPLQWTLYWLVAPNLAMMMMWPLGGPPMGKPVLIAGCLGLIFSQLPWPRVKRIAAIALTLTMGAVYIGRNFNLDPAQLILLPTFLTEAAPLRSPLYVAAAVSIAVSLWLAGANAPRVPRFGITMNWLLGFLAVIGVIRFDNFATAETRGSYDTLPPGQMFASAVETTGYDHPGAVHRNLVVIVVESLGVPLSPAARGQFDADWDRPAWRSGYAVSHGNVPYLGATVNGEIRELCGVWSIPRAINWRDAACLPTQYKRAGYETSAIHAFAGDFFNRQDWWREAGFDHREFREDLVAKGARVCGGVFPGACDDDIPAQIGARLKSAQRPQLVYWVTLNSHLPVVEEATLGTANCTFGGTALAAESALFCPLFLVHHHLAEAITRLAMDPKLPPTDFLIVGDHMPPYFERDARVRFEAHSVPWILLKARPRGLSHTGT